VVEGVTGTFFHEQSPQALAEAVRNFDDARYDPAVIREHAEQFDTAVFKQRLRQFIEEKANHVKRDNVKRET